MTLKTFLILDGEETPIEVLYDYIPGSHGHRDRYGAPEEPDEDPTIEIISIHVPEGPIEVDECTFDNLTTECLNHYSSFISSQDLI